MDTQEKLNRLKKLQNGSDIRGVALATDGQPANLNREEARALSLGFVEYLTEKTGKEAADLTIAVGCDSRVTGPFLKGILCETFAQEGASVLDAGLASTPAMFMATQFPETACDGAVMITASHLPVPRNGFKYFDRDGGLQKADIANIIVAAAEQYEPGDPAETAAATIAAASELTEHATHTAADYGGDPLLMDRYAKHLRDLIEEGVGRLLPLEGMRILVDAGNGAGGFYAEKVLAPLGADLSGSQFLEPDGTFPNHEPNPENKQAMEAVTGAVTAAGAELGLIFDTDVDRSAAVTGSGRPVARNGIVALAAALLADDHPGATIVTDSITSVQLADFLENTLGLKHLRFKRGYKNVINKAQELTAEGIDCPLAIETSGHAALAENFFLDDGAYLATKIVIQAAKLKEQGRTIDDLLADLAEPLEAGEFRLPIVSDDFAAAGDKILADLESYVAGKAAGPEGALLPGGDAPLLASLVQPNYEGVRIDFYEPDEPSGTDSGSAIGRGEYVGWALLRKSLHDPLMPLNIEADRAGGLTLIRRCLKEFLTDYPELDTEAL